jgi:membrane protein
MPFHSVRSKIKTRVVNLMVMTGNEPRKSVTSPHMFSMRDWRFVLLETRLALKDKKMPILAAGTAFFASLAFFTLLAAIVAIVAYIVDVGELNATLMALKIYFPIDIAALLGTHLESAFEYNLRNIVVAIVAIVIALITSSQAMATLISSINTAYEKKETRPALKLFLMSVSMALIAIVIITVVLGLVLIDENWLLRLGLPEFLALSLPLLRWIFLALIIAVSLALFYRFAPSDHNPRWTWVSWGAVIATVFWLGGTTLFFLYARYLSAYTNIYNVFGSVIVLLIWLNLSAFIILLGAEINHRLEQRTTRRTTH